MLSFLITLDIYEAMTGLRSYRKDWPHNKVIKTISGELKQIGLQFVPLLQAVKEECYPQQEQICPL